MSSIKETNNVIYPFKDFIKHGIFLDEGNWNESKKTAMKGLPKNWPILTESKYNRERNFLIPTGKINDIIVIDLDAKERSETNTKSDTSIQWFEQKFGKIEELDTLVTKTPGGGYHIFYKYNLSVKVINCPAINVDILTTGKGVNQGHRYTLLVDKPINSLSEDQIQYINKLKTFKGSVTENTLKEFLEKQEEEMEVIDTSVIKRCSEFANNEYKFKDKTCWDISQLSNGSYKASPDSKWCPLCDRYHSESHHCAFFFNKNDTKMVCYSNNNSITIEKKLAKKLAESFCIVINYDETQSLYQELVERLLEIAKENNYKREKNTGIVYKQVKEYAYEKYLEPKDFLNKIFYGDKDFKKNSNNMDNLLKFMRDYNDPDFSFLEYNKDYIGFSNGVLNIITCEIHEKKDIIVGKYIDKEFTESTETPLFDSILDYQFNPEVRDFIYMCLGRMFGIRDNFGFMLYLLGEAGCGKSLIIDILSECFNNVGAISNTFEEKFGLSFLYNKDIVVCDDLPKGISKIFPQQVFQTCITQGKISIAIKGKDAITVEWKPPLLFAGNWLPDYLDKGQISRRMLVANFEKIVSNPDPTLKNRIMENEIPAFIYKSLLAYKNLLENSSNNDIWRLCPEYFLDQQLELKLERNPLYKFLYENTHYSEGNIISLEDVRINFNKWLGTTVKSLDNGTFYQVNNEYIILTILACRYCKQQHIKGCCNKYNRTQRGSRKIVKNLKFNDNL